MLVSRGVASVLALAPAVVMAPAIAEAGPDDVVTSALDDVDGFDLTFNLDYRFETRRAAIRRERVGLPGTSPGDPLPVRDDLVFDSQRHVLTPELELGLFHDVWLSAALPYVVTDTRTLSFDRRDTPCSLSPGRCVSRANSSTIQDGILPDNGYDAHDPAVGFANPDGDMIFRSPDRSGVDQIRLGLGWAPMNQRRDDTKPTWKLGGEARIAVGKVATLEPGNPESATGVGTGVHELRLWTTIARRIGWAEPYVDLWWQAPIGMKSGSPFQNPGFGARNTDKQQEAGVVFGVDAAAFSRPDDDQRVSLDLSARLVGHFEGRNYTEMWEVFAFAGRNGGPLELDSDPTTSGMQGVDHPGITNVENYLEMGGRIALRAELGPWVQLAALAQATGETEHVITFADAGVDLPRCQGAATDNCETDNNDLVNPNTAEVNPLHVPLIDLVGHRYRLDDVFDLQVGVEATVLF